MFPLKTSTYHLCIDLETATMKTDNNIAEINYKLELISITTFEWKLEKRRGIAIESNILSKSPCSALPASEPFEIYLRKMAIQVHIRDGAAKQNSKFLCFAAPSPTDHAHCSIPSTLIV